MASTTDPKKVTRLRNGAYFEYIGPAQSETIIGQYKDYSGEWVRAVWYGDGQIVAAGTLHSDHALDWDSAHD